jgi:hypothetical protein
MQGSQHKSLLLLLASLLSTQTAADIISVHSNGGDVEEPPSFPDLPLGFHSDIDEISVSSGHFHTCALSTAPGVEFGGPLKCWGSNDFGQADAPEGTFVQVSCGLHHTCAVAIDETVKCWGSFEQVSIIDLVFFALIAAS